MRILKLRSEYGFGFSRLVERIVELDQNDGLYRAVLAEPWVAENAPQSVERVRQRWIRIFSSNSKANGGSR